MTDKKAAEVSPKEIRSKSRIYNLVGALQFKALYGIDLIGEFQATPAELRQAEAFYEEYLEYKDDRKPPLLRAGQRNGIPHPANRYRQHAGNA